MDPAQVVRDPDGVMRCRQCGFRYALTPGGAVERSGEGLVAVREAVASTPPEGRDRRPRPAVWSVNAYTAHLADAAGIINTRLRLIVEQDRPPLPWHDENRAAEEGGYDARPAAGSLHLLTQRVTAYQELLRTLPPTAWERAGIHSRAGEVRFADIAHDMVHELEHHALDIREVGSSA